MNFFKIGFYLAGIANIAGVLLVSKLFTNPAISEASPVVMSNFGLLMIIVWGFAYIAVANAYEKVPLLLIVFTVEKLIYTFTWFFWIQQNDLTILYTKDLLAGIFYTLYGLNDFVFMLFFASAFWVSRKSK